MRSKKAANPEAPAASALAYGMFARAESVLLLADGLIAAAVLGIAFELSSFGVVSLGQAGGMIVASCIPILVGSVVVAVVYGQSGSRVFKRLSESETMLVDNDEHWKLGIFYWNPQDASLFLPERFGIGWTVNWARPAIWVILAAGVALTVAFVVGVFLLV